MILAAEADKIQRLISDWQAGIEKEENFRGLFDHFYRPVLRFFQKRGFPAEDCHDLTEETFVRVYRGMEGFRGESRFDTWLFQIAANTYRKALRHRSAIKRGNEVLIGENLIKGHGDTADVDPMEVPSGTSGPLDDLIEKERTRLLRDAMQGLPNQMRRCVMLRIYQELSYQEIATVMRISVDTVKAHLFQARQKLKESLVEYFGEIDV
ncbi:MAG: sigma-70 family RNA polymerase sigma factor [Acidobacteria bacterium]|nr:sigma-70 family RNA polymerase sigma factor [Acidobacteriota bacterium]